MAKGIYRQWKQPLSFTFSHGPTKSAQLKTMLVDVISECQKVGLEVVATICDQGSNNRAAINSLLNNTKEQFLRAQQNDPYFGFVLNGEEIVPLYDVPHLFKGIRNNLITKNLHFEEDKIPKYAKWSHIKQFYKLDTMEDTRLAGKLTDKHVLAPKMNKMKVSLMAQLFSYKVGSLIQRISKWNISSEYSLPREAAQTGDFFLFMDKLFDSLNGNSKTAPSSKPLKGGISKGSGHEEFWRSALITLKTMRFWDGKKKKYVNIPSVINLIKTVEGFLHIKKKLIDSDRVSYLLPRAMNQDCLENFFASIRTHGRRYTILQTWPTL